MGSTLTSKLGLIKPFRDVNTKVDINDINTNMDKLDDVSGAMMVENGVMPPAANLFHGRIIREKTSGKTWVAQKQNDGTFIKKWITYPWSLVAYAYYPVLVLNNSQGGAEYPGFGWQAAYGRNGVPGGWYSGINSSVSDLDGSGNVLIPVDGVYTGFIVHRYENPTTGYVIAGSVRLNDAPQFRVQVDVNSEVVGQTRGAGPDNYSSLVIPINHYLPRGTKVSSFGYNGYSGSQALYTSIFLALAQPGLQSTGNDL